MVYRILKNVEMPRAKTGPGGGKYPFKDMEVGSMFYLYANKEGTSVALLQNRVSASSIRIKGMKFSTRTIDNNTVGVWRVA